MPPRRWGWNLSHGFLCSAECCRALLVAATGERDQDIERYLEGALIDTGTGKAVLRVVRKGFGKTLRNDSTDLKPLIDEFTTDVLRS
ncbi:hypothetical protein D3C78_1161960 [compost metagenome]